MLFCNFIEAVHQYYESHRHLFNDEKPLRKEQATKAKKKGI